MNYYAVYIDEVENKYFTYSSNEDYQPGEWVWVIFGGKDKAGLIIEQEKGKSYEYRILEIKSRVAGSILFSENYLKLLLWIKEYYLASFREIITTVYPKGLKVKYSDKAILLNVNILPMNDQEDEFFKYMKKKKEVTVATLKKNFSSELVNKMKDKKIIKIEKKVTDSREKSEEINIIENAEITNRRKLTEEQNQAVDTIINTNKKHFLVYGVTGSGKTEVYIEIVVEAFRKNQGVIILVPEISLTPQMVSRFKSVFGNRIAVLHSRLTQKQRSDEWLEIYTGKKKIVLGVRSAIFAPVQDLKYIIIDEEHEGTYKQDINPRYNAKTVALKRVENEGAKIILGSATPSIESMYYAKTGVFKLIELKNRYSAYKPPEMKVINMKGEKDENFSLFLLDEIHKRLKDKEQTLLFLNRKGYSNFVQCRECAHIEKCDNCSVSYIYYKNENLLKCSYCGKTVVFSEKCRKCSSKNLKFYGLGTEKLEMELKRYFKTARVLRVDSDTVRERESYSKMYKDFMDHKYDIMLGTQIISKGLHFPQITLAGIISADTILNFPDFRAGEKTFQAIVQAAGRSGRGDIKGEVVIQTLTPEHYVIEKAIKSDYEGFYKTEEEFRKILNYPPFGKIINIIISSEDEYEAENDAEAFGRLIREDAQSIGVEMYGPFKAPLYKINKRYRFQIFIKSEREKINSFKDKLKEAYFSMKNIKARVTIDIDPMNLM